LGVKKRPISTPKQVVSRPVLAGDNRAKLAALLAQRDALMAENAALIAQLNATDLLVEKLKLQIARVNRTAFGSSSEKDKALLAQLELALDDLETADGQAKAPAVPVAPIEGPFPDLKVKPARRPLPDHLPRESVEYAPVTAHSVWLPVNVLEPDAGKTKTGRLWAYVGDERGHSGARPPAAVYYYSSDRQGKHPVGHLSSFRGSLHADGYAGYNPLYAPTQPDEPARVAEVACMAHVRRKFYDIHIATASPIAGDAIKHIAALYGIEKEARGQSPDARKAIRQAKALPLMTAFKEWLEHEVTRIPRGGDLAVAF
jgi:hypothetical protein